MRYSAKILKDRYDLTIMPTDQQVLKWYEKTLEHRNNGYTFEEAGRKAAFELFRTWILEKRFQSFAQADDIETILNMIKNGQ